jgi:sortase A
MVAGAGALVWTLVVWQWRDPLTSIYTELAQRRLADRYEALLASAPAVEDGDLAAAGRTFRAHAQRGDPIGRLTIERLDLDVLVVEGTDDATLRKGPGRDRRSFMPGEGKLVYLAGHRTTFLAPFADIDRLRPGDRMSLETPYGRFVYAVTGHRVVEKTDLSVLRPTSRETLRLQACHPRFFASRRWVVSARLVQALPRGGRRQAGGEAGFTPA